MFDSKLTAYKNALQSEEKSAHTVEKYLRHLFARTFYGIKKDIAKPADILGHAGIDTTRIYVVSTAAIVDDGGPVLYGGHLVDGVSGCVRPALWITLDS